MMAKLLLHTKSHSLRSINRSDFSISPFLNISSSIILTLHIHIDLIIHDETLKALCTDPYLDSCKNHLLCMKM